MSNHSQTGLCFLYFDWIKVAHLHFIYLTFSFLFDSFPYQNPQCFIMPEWEFKRCLNILERLSLDFFFPKGQDFIHLPVTLDRTWKFQRDGIILLQFPISSIYGFLRNFVIKFFSLTKPRGEQGVGRKKKLTHKKKISTTLVKNFPNESHQWDSEFLFFGFRGFFLDFFFFSFFVQTHFLIINYKLI